MTIAGERSTVIPSVSLADEILVNRDNSTARQTVDKFALQLMSSTAIGSLSDARQLYPTRADLPAASGVALRFSAVVFNDPDGNNNGTWSVQLDNLGAKIWLWSFPLQFSVITGEDLGEGTANAIEVSTIVPVADGIMTSFRPFRESLAGVVTVSFNGDEPLTIRDAGGSALVAAASVKAGVTISGFRSGDFFDLITDVDASASAASAAASALLAHNTAEDFLDTLDAALTLAVTGATSAAGGSATSAGTSATLAGRWATEAEDVEVEPGKYSAYHWAQKAEDTVTAGVSDGSVTEDKLATALAEKVNGALPKTGGVMTGAIQDATFAPSSAPTKKLGFDLSAISAGTTKNLIMPNRNVDLAKLETWELLGTFTQAAVANVPITGLFDNAKFDRYRVQIDELVPVTNAVNLNMEVSTDNGATWLVTSIYTTKVIRWDDAGSTYGGATNAAAMAIATAHSNGATQYLSGEMLFYHDKDNNVRVRASFETFSSAGNFVGSETSARIATGAKINAIRFRTSSGNVAALNGRVYGRLI